jgi:hypothetical protein
MKTPNRRDYDDDPDGYEAAWNSYECEAETRRDWKRDEAAEKETEQKNDED